MKGIFKMDYSNGITVFIGNEGFYAEGELRDRAITLPVSGSELQGFLEGNGLLPLMGRSGFRTGPTSCAMLRRGRHRSGAFRHSQCVRAENVKVLGC